MAAPAVEDEDPPTRAELAWDATELTPALAVDATEETPSLTVDTTEETPEVTVPTAPPVVAVATEVKRVETALVTVEPPATISEDTVEMAETPALAVSVE